MLFSLFRQRPALVCSLVLGGALLVSGCGGGSGGTAPTLPPTGDPSVLLYDQFNSFDTVNSWSVQGGGYTIQRTLMGNQPAIVNDGSTSFVRLPLSTYVSDPYRSQGKTMFGTEFASYALFPRSQGLRFTARIRMTSATQQGLVGGFFLFSSKLPDKSTPQTIDEIDHELLTTAYSPKSGSPYTWTNIYKNFVIAQNFQGNQIGGKYDDKNTTISTAPGFVQGYKTNDWNIYTIEWKAGDVKWFINGQQIREETGLVPDSPLGMRFNFWVSNSSWQNAYSDSPVLNGVSDPSQAQNFYMDMDYVKVETLDGKAPTSSSSALKRAAPTRGVTMADYRGK